ncbi:Lrp/AsnC ligand binding domain-containing protein [Mucilaginibacter lacusdianchii]|uniref:Lrp/AsnC ligand binding domain-containing protein n=1 Tax=Mucilaginibacter lacusdianchii TaxID=2684211 RepID=UPI001E5C3937|nr:Lrp/AsnC ligand binding domain-containing protein [Mucilaginibacter sp. JXJ CY 39]
MTGISDFILHIANSNMDAYYDFYRINVFRLPCITTLQSSFVLSGTKSQTAYPLSCRRPCTCLLNLRSVTGGQGSLPLPFHLIKDYERY